ncbi:hypothetical protein MBLNU457_2356t1 [Dothideomycetes sp. NU457]
MSSDTFKITHASDGTTHTRPNIFSNPHRRDTQSAIQPTTADSALTLHQQLPSYGPTPLHPLPSISVSLGQHSVLLKDESTRFGASSFKILGASYAIYRSLCQELHLPSDTPLSSLRNHLNILREEGRKSLTLVTASAGNWGRAVARTGSEMGVRSVILVPFTTDPETVQRIKDEGGEVDVRVLDQDYDSCVLEAEKLGMQRDWLLTMDTSWSGYEVFPRWVVDGYETMLAEVDEQVRERGLRKVDMVVVSVGVGSWAQAVVEHYRDSGTRVVAVEPEMAAGLFESLVLGDMVTVSTGRSIMNGMNCGTVSRIAWPGLRDGVDIAVAVGEDEVHRCVGELKQLGLDVGPCGAAPLAAVRRLRSAGLLDDDGVVVLFSTEGSRAYDIPSGS